MDMEYYMEMEKNIILLKINRISYWNLIKIKIFFIFFIILFIIYLYKRLTKQKKFISITFFLIIIFLKLFSIIIIKKIYMKLYEGHFKEGKYHGLGKNYEDNYLGNYLYYNGIFNNNIFDGKGILFYQNGIKFYEGNFKMNKIEGKGIKYYQNGSKKLEGIFDTLNYCEGKYYDPQNNEIYIGRIKNEIPIDSMKMVIYNDNTNKLYEGEMSNGVYEGYGTEYNPLVK